jgi:hypothetical protein
VEVDKAFKDKYNPGPTELPDFKFIDTRPEAPRFGVSANFATFTGWSPVETKEWKMIDFVLGGSNQTWCVLLFHRSRRWCGLEGGGRCGLHLILLWLMTALGFLCVDRLGRLPHAKSVRG